MSFTEVLPQALLEEVFHYFVRTPPKDYLEKESAVHLSRVSICCRSFDSAASRVGRGFVAALLHAPTKYVSTSWCQLLRFRTFLGNRSPIFSHEHGKEYLFIKDLFIWCDIYELSGIQDGVDDPVYASAMLAHCKDASASLSLRLTFAQDYIQEPVDNFFSFLNDTLPIKATPNGNDRFGLNLDDIILQVKAITPSGKFFFLLEWTAPESRLDTLSLDHNFLQQSLQFHETTLKVRLYHPHVRHRVSQIGLYLKFPHRIPCATYYNSFHHKALPPDSDTSSHSRSNKTIKLYLFRPRCRRQKRHIPRAPLVRGFFPGTKIQLIMHTQRLRQKQQQRMHCNFQPISPAISSNSWRHTPPPLAPIVQRIQQNSTSSYANTDHHHHHQPPREDEYSIVLR